MQTETAPPDRYPFPSWQDDGPFAVPAELRQHYAAAVPQPEVALAVQEATGKGFTVLRLFPRRKAEQMALDGHAQMPDFQPARGDDNLRVRVPVSRDEWLHVRRTEEAEKVAKQEARTKLPLDTSTCAACGATAPATSNEVRPRIGAPYRLGIRGPLCGACADVAAVVLAEQVLPDGRTRRQAVAEAAGLAGPSRAEEDRQRVLALSQRQ